ncbi:MAG: M23 family metallopeptidase [Acidobacteria bacterium]|nr:M23 family metallopeptidase [Acidobacteriota bacterium]
MSVTKPHPSRTAAFAGAWGALLLLGLVLLPLPGLAQSNELIVDWPVGAVNGSDFVPGYGFRVQQRYGNHNDCIDHDNGVWVILRDPTPECTEPPCYICARRDDQHRPGETTGDGYRVHAGLDLERISGSSTGQPVYAAADGRVDCVRTPTEARYPGGVIVVEHTVPGGDLVYTMYGHVDNISVAQNDQISRGTQIATIFNQSNPHLHFEVRDFDENGYEGCAGDGYTQAGEDDPGAEDYRDPAAYYFDASHRPELPITVTINGATANLRSAPSVVTGDILSTATQDMRLPALVLAADADGTAGRYWYQVRIDQANTGYVAAYNVPNWSGELLTLERDRSPYTGPTGCTCSWGADSNGSPIPDSNTFCGYQVCGGDFQFYGCFSFGWGALGKVNGNDCSSPEPLDSGCTCYGGVRYGGSSIDPSETFCGMQVCGADNQYYSCQSGGWAFEGGGPCA